MDKSLNHFLKNKHPIATDSDVWANGTMPLTIKSYCCPEMPPSEYITSIRCILLHQDKVLVMRNSNGHHIIPGGRIEEGEHFEQTLKRELLEETGWTLSDHTYLGFMHFHHLKPKPPQYKYPHPDFLQLIYTAQAQAFNADAKCADDYEIEATFCDLIEIDALEIPTFQRAYLNAAQNAQQQTHLRPPQ